MANFNDMTVRQLRDYCRDNEVRGYSKYVGNRHKFVQFLEGWVEAEAATAGAEAIRESLEEAFPEVEELQPEPAPVATAVDAGVDIGALEAAYLLELDEHLEPEPQPEPMQWQLQAIYLAIVAIGFLIEGAYRLAIGSRQAWAWTAWFATERVLPTTGQVIYFFGERLIPRLA